MVLWFLNIPNILGWRDWHIWNSAANSNGNMNKFITYNIISLNAELVIRYFCIASSACWNWCVHFARSAGERRDQWLGQAACSGKAVAARKAEASKPSCIQPVTARTEHYSPLSGQSLQVRLSGWQHFFASCFSFLAAALSSSLCLPFFLPLCGISPSSCLSCPSSYSSSCRPSCLYP